MSEIKKTAEQVSFELISHAGNSKSCSMEAMAAADQGNYELVDLKLKEADAPKAKVAEKKEDSSGK